MKKFICAILCVAACATPVGYTQGTPEVHSMARPTVFPSWATNANYAGGPDIGTPTKVAPSGGRVADGWRNADVPPAQEQNYEMALLGDWVNWFDNALPDLAALSAMSGVQVGTKAFVKNYGWYTYGPIGPSVDGINVVDATGMGLGVWTHQSVGIDEVSTVAALAGLPGRTVTSRAFVSGMGWYDWHVTPSFTPDGFWVVTAIGIGAGQWVHEELALARFPMIGNGGIATVGPTPDESFTSPTAPGRINKQVIDHGFWAEDFSTASATYATTLATPAPLATLSSSALAGAMLNDMIDFSINAVAKLNTNAVGCNIWTEYSQDGGGTWVPMTNSTDVYWFAVANAIQAVNLSFHRRVTVTGPATLQIRVMAISDGTHLLELNVQTWHAVVKRP